MAPATFASLRFPLEIWEIVFAHLGSECAALLIPCASTCYTLRCALLERVFERITLLVEDVPRMLGDDGLMSALGVVGPLVCEVVFTSRQAGEAPMRWANAESDRPLFPCATSILIDHIHFMHFNHLFACIAFVGSAFARLRLRRVRCAAYTYHRLLQARGRGTVAEIAVDPGSPALRLEPLLLWARGAPLTALRVAVYDTLDDLQSLLWFLGQPECRVEDLDIQLCVQGAAPRFLPSEMAAVNKSARRLTLRADAYAQRDLLDAMLDYGRYVLVRHLTLEYSLGGRATVTDAAPSPEAWPVERRMPDLAHVDVVFKGCPPGMDDEAKARLIASSRVLAACHDRGQLRAQFVSVVD